MTKQLHLQPQLSPPLHPPSDVEGSPHTDQLVQVPDELETETAPTEDYPDSATAQKVYTMDAKTKCGPSSVEDRRGEQTDKTPLTTEGKLATPQLEHELHEVQRPSSPYIAPQERTDTNG
ncbi:hypothetical protein MRX96_026088 [Rhipicephalus microplus]